MKGRKLTIKEVKNLKDGDKVYIVPSKTLSVALLDNEGLANIRRLDNIIVFYPENGKDKMGWNWNQDKDLIQNGSWLDVYKWVEESNQQAKQTNKSIHNKIKELKQEMQDLEKKLAEQNIKEDLVNITMHQVETVNYNHLIDGKKLRLPKHRTLEDNFHIGFTRDGNKIVCVFSNDFVIGTGTSKCHEDDDFNYNTGMGIAEYRARADFYTRLANLISM